MSLLDFVKFAYAAMVVCVLCLEITRSSRLARRWAQMAIVLATVGGSTWVYAAHINRHPSTRTVGGCHHAKQAQPVIPKMKTANLDRATTA